MTGEATGIPYNKVFYWQRIILWFLQYLTAFLYFFCPLVSTVDEQGRGDWPHVTDVDNETHRAGEDSQVEPRLRCTLTSLMSLSLVEMASVRVYFLLGHALHIVWSELAATSLLRVPKFWMIVMKSFGLFCQLALKVPTSGGRSRMPLFAGSGTKHWDL